MADLERYIDQGTGREPADIVLKGGQFFDLVTGELIASDIAISNERIVGIEGDYVAFRVRAEAGSGKKRTVRLPGVEFIGRFLLHVLPAGFKRIRHYGLLSPARKRSGLAAARAALEVPASSAALVESVADFLRRVVGIEHACCPCCGRGRMRVVALLAPAPPALHLRGPP